MPTAHAAIHEPFHKFWMMGASTEAGSGRSKKNASLAVQPVRARPVSASAAVPMRTRLDRDRSVLAGRRAATS